MSSDLERILREARQALPTPDEASSESARARVLDTVHPQRLRKRTRVLVLAAATLVTALLLGVTAGSLNAPSVTAAREPAVLGFVPQPGWYALQSPPAAIEGQQTAAVAANVPFAPDDVENGLVEPSGLPYATLLSLPADGIVLVATMTPQSVATVPLTWLPYTEVELPLRLRDAMPVLLWGAQVRPDQPLAQYHLSGSLHEHNVDLVVYFGTPQPSAALMREAQRQLDGFMFRPGNTSGRTEAKATAAPSPAVAIVDRTYSCETVILGGIYEVEARAHAGLRSGSRWSKLPYAVASTGGWAGTLLGNPFARENSLAWVTAGAPSAGTTADFEGETFPIQTGGTIGVNSSLCRPTRAAVPLRSTGLRGGAVGVRGRASECASPRRVLVRVRATTLAGTSFNRRGNVFLATDAVARRGELAVRTAAGKLLAYAAVDGSGKSTLFTARGCGRE